LNAGNGSLNKPETTSPTYFHHIRDGTWMLILAALDELVRTERRQGEPLQ